MQPIQINVQVNIGLDTGLSKLLSKLLPGLLPRAAEGRVELTPSPEEKEITDAAVKEAAEAQAGKITQEQNPVPEPETAPEPEAPAKEETKKYTEADVRAAIDRTRKRIIGEDYRAHPDSEMYKKWYRALSDWFKNTSAVFGGAKPSLLPDSESRAKFIACCDAVYVKDGVLTEDCPY